MAHNKKYIDLIYTVKRCFNETVDSTLQVLYMYLANLINSVYNILYLPPCQVMFLVALVCLSVCVCLLVDNITQNVMNGFG